MFKLNFIVRVTVNEVVLIFSAPKFMFDGEKRKKMKKEACHPSSLIPVLLSSYFSDSRPAPWLACLTLNCSHSRGFISRRNVWLAVLHMNARSLIGCQALPARLVNSPSISHSAPKRWSGYITRWVTEWTLSSNEYIQSFLIDIMSWK